MKKLIITVLLASCGAQDKKESPVSDPEIAGETEPTINSAETVLAAKKALYVADGASLPACNVDNDRQLIYVADASEFRHCAKGQWLAIDLTPKVEKFGSWMSDPQIGYVENGAAKFSTDISSFRMTEMPDNQVKIVVIGKDTGRAPDYEILSVYVPRGHLSPIVASPAYTLTVTDWHAPEGILASLLYKPTNMGGNLMKFVLHR
jgi:hypothetical protein